jgi:hypothetical protein
MRLIMEITFSFWLLTSISNVLLVRFGKYQGVGHKLLVQIEGEEK